MSHLAHTEISPHLDRASELHEEPDSSTTAREIPSEAKRVYEAALRRSLEGGRLHASLELVESHGAEGYSALAAEQRAIAAELGRVSAKTFPDW